MTAPTILLVDDDPNVRRTLRATLLRSGYEVLEAIDGQSALNLLGAHAVDLIFLDLRLPDMNGLDLAEALARDAQHGAVPVVAVSGVANTLEQTSAIEGRFADFLLKPVSAGRLLEVTRSHLQLEVDGEELPGRKRLVLVAHGEELVRRTLGLRFRRQGFRVVETSDGAQAINSLDDESPAAVVSGVPMTHVDGFGLAEHFASDPELARIPVVLVSPRALETRDVDGALAAGAWAYVQTGVSCEEALTTVVRLLDSVSYESSRRAPAAAASPVDEESLRDSLRQTWREEGEPEPTSQPEFVLPSQDGKTSRLLGELERQSRIAKELTRITNRQAAQLSVLAGVSETLTRTRDPQAAIEEALARCMDVSVFNRGAAFLCGEGGSLHLASRHGFDGDAIKELFEHQSLLDLALEHDEIITLPSARFDAHRATELLTSTGTRAMQVVPLAVGGQHLGVLVLGSRERGLRRRGYAFARTIQGQLAQALLLGHVLDQLAISEQRFRRVTERMAEGLFTSNRDGRITFVNDAARRLLGLRGALPDLSLEDLLPGIELSRPVWEGTALARDGSRPIVRVSTSVHATGAELERTHIVQDVTDARRQEEHLRVLAERDALTGLLNRRSFLGRVQAAVEASRESGTSGAVLFVDLDGFKRINDTHGHAAGDHVLETLSEALTTRLRRTDVVGRIGGDEFAVLQTGADARSAEGLGHQILRIVTGLRIRVAGTQVSVGASIGGVVFPQDGSSGDLLMDRADAAMYQAKGSGGDCVLMWDADSVPPRLMGTAEEEFDDDDLALSLVRGAPDEEPVTVERGPQEDED